MSNSKPEEANGQPAPATANGTSAPNATASATPAAPGANTNTNSSSSNNNNNTNNSSNRAVEDEFEGDTPRDVRLLHLILASMGVTSYQDRVPLQLMDFAYRFTHGVLQDALLYNDHAHSSTTTTPAGLGPAHVPLTTEDIRLAVAARVNYQFKPAPPKELLLELAQEKNRKPLPAVQEQWGVRLPPEKYCLTAKEWDFEEEEQAIRKKKQKTAEDVIMAGTDASTGS
ncbi:hypothetical protein DS838_000531 [Geotrichum bryndzae]|nr:hypothetical protein DS838_000531 [Geotrichum bryndzae]